MRRTIKTFLQTSLILGAILTFAYTITESSYQISKRARDDTHERELQTLALVHAQELRLEEVRWERRSTELGATQWVYGMIAERVIDALQALLDGNSPLQKLKR
jgi:hypothetical protein